MSEAQRMLRGEGLEVWRGERCLFEALDFVLHTGQLAVLVGPNGVGKTTLLRTIAGFAPATAGRAIWNGVDVRALEPAKRAEIAYVGHLEGLKRELTLAENLRFYAALCGADAERIPPLLAALKLDGAAALRVRQLSAGQRRRAALAALRLRGAPLWLLDEPTTNLDADGRALVTEWVRAHCAGGGLAMIATHQPDAFAAPGALVIEL